MSEKLKCVAEVTPDESECLEKCEGIHVTSYDSFEKDSSLESIISKLSIEYNKFKEAFEFPIELKGTFINIEFYAA